MSAKLSKLQQRRELARQQKKEIAAKAGRRERTVKPAPGRSRWRILPATSSPDELNIGHAWGQHFVRNANDDLVAIHMCMEATYGKHCPICDALQEAIRKSDDATQEVLVKAKAQSRFIMNALQLDGEDPNTPVLLDLTSTTYEKLMDQIDQWGDAEFGEVDIVDPLAGRDIVITRTGKGIGTKYDVTVSPKERAVDPDVLTKLYDLGEYVDQLHVLSQEKAIAELGNVAAGISSLPAPASGSDEDMDDILDGDYDEVIEATPEKVSKSAKSDKAAISEADEAEIDDILGDLEDLDL